MHSPMRRIFFATAALCIAAVALPAYADDKPLRILVGFAPGGVTDVVARTVAEKLRESLGRTVLVENKPGAGGRIAAADLKAAAPDGNTIMVTTETIAVLAPFVFKDLPFDSKKDFVPLSQLATFQLALTIPASVPAKNFAEYAAWLKADPSRANFGAVSGSQSQFLGSIIGDSLGLKMNYVPYAGGAQMAQDLAGGHLNAGLDAVSQNAQAHKAGKVRILATTGSNRSPMVPDVPTFKELGYPIETTGYLAAFAPAGTPPAVVQKLSDAMVQAMKSPDVQQKMLAAGLESAGVPSEELARLMDSGTQRWAGVVKKIGFVPQ